MRAFDTEFAEGCASGGRGRATPRPMDEMYLRINGELFYLWRAVDQHGVVFDILVQERRTPQPPSVSANACWSVANTSRARSSQMSSAATPSRSVRSCPVCGIGPAALPHQSCRELPQADATARTPDAALQVTWSSPAVPLGTRDDLWPLPSTATPDARQTGPPFARQDLPDLVAGSLCPDGGVTSRKLHPAVKLV